MSYFSDLRAGIRTTLKGLSLTVRHLGNATHRRQPMGVAEPDYFALTDGLVTLEYPHEKLPVPDNGRYRLHNEIDDCIVCDKCAKVCPVDCITIDPIKATEEVGRASDGSPIRLYAATFDIDMAKCCYCGLCTAVCPTECLTMEKTFDYSTFNLASLTYEFASLTPEQADEKRALYEQFVQEKEAAKRAKTAELTPSTANVPDPETPAAEQAAKPKPAFRPGMKPPTKASPPTAETISPATENVPGADVPGMDTPNATAPGADLPGIDVPAESAMPAKPRPVFRPGMKPAAKASSPDAPAATGNAPEGPQQHPLTDPTPDEAEQIAMAGVAEQPHVTEPLSAAEKNVPAPDSALPATPKKTAPFRPTMKPAASVAPSADTPPAGEIVPTAEHGVKPKAGFRPTMKPAAPADTAPSVSDPAAEAAAPETPKPKPAFRPTMKPAAPKSVDTAAPDAALNVPAVPIPTPVVDSSVAAPESNAPTEPGTSAKPRPAFRPTMKPKAASAAEPMANLPDDPSATGDTERTPDADGVRSTEATSSASVPADESGTSPKPKPAFRPTMKPKSSDS